MGGRGFSAGSRERRRHHVVRHALVRFAMWSAVALLVLVAGTVITASRMARAEALEEYGARAERLARVFASPLVDESARRGEVGKERRIERLLDQALLGGSLERVSLWAQDGTVLWSDQASTIGREHRVPAGVDDRLGTTFNVAEITDPDQFGLETFDDEELLAVYAGSVDDRGVPLVFEVLWSTAPIERREAALLTGMLPIAIGSLVLLQLAVLPLALTLARRVQRSEIVRARMTAHALEASELERRRVAQELHDGVVQDLAGVSFSLRSVGVGLADTAEGVKARATLTRMKQVLLADIKALRTMMIDLYPPDLEQTGLKHAVISQAKRQQGQGVAVEVAVGDGPCSVELARVAYRVVREGLVNVVKHSSATRAVVQVETLQGELVVRVADNGRGVTADRSHDGHLGLRLLDEAVRDCGGSLELSTASSGLGGAVLEARLPSQRNPQLPQHS